MTTYTTFKRFAFAIVSLLLSLCVFAAAAACVDDKTLDETVFDNGASMTLVIEEEPLRKVEVDLAGMSRNCSLLDVLDKAKIRYDAQDGFLTSVGGLTPAAPEYIYLYTSVETDFDVSQYPSTIDFDGKTLTNSGVGAAEMTIKDGCVVYVGTIVYL